MAGRIFEAGLQLLDRQLIDKDGKLRRTDDGSWRYAISLLDLEKSTKER